MSNKFTPVLAMLFAAGAATSQARAEDDAAPQLRVIQLTGEISVTAPGGLDELSGQDKLPFIISDAEVRVLSGTALFQTDSQATLTATEGDAFLFSTRPGQEGTPPAMTIKAVGPETSLHFAFGGKRYLIRNDGAVDIRYEEDGKNSVTVTGGYVALLPGTYLHAGESITVSTTNAPGDSMAPGDSLTAANSKERGFDMLPVNLSSLGINRKDDATFLAKAGRAGDSGLTGGTETAEKIIASWPIVSRLTAGFLIEKYGAPDEVSDVELTWVDNAPWKKTMVHKEGVLRSAPRRIVHQSVGYDVPKAKLSALQAMDMGLTANRGRKELSAASESEEANFLALNLANDVISGRMTVEDAKEAYQRTLTLAAAGKSSPYTETLTFESR